MRPRGSIWVERTLIVTGLALLVFAGSARLAGEFQSRRAVKRFEAVRNARFALVSDRRADGGGGAQGVDTSLWSPERVRAYEESLRKDFGVPLAILSIPKLQLEVPVLEGTDDLTLNRGVGRIAGTARPGNGGNLGIAGHRDGFFRGLKDISVGDAIELRTLAGLETYVVDSLRVVSPDDVWVLDPTPAPVLTLVTCYPFYFVGNAPQRFIVRAVRHEPVPGRQAGITPSTPGSPPPR